MQIFMSLNESLGVRKLILGLCIALLLIAPTFNIKSHAMDPVTIAILTPVAIKCAEIAAPYVWRGLQCGGNHLVKMGIDVIDVFRLPLGVIQVTLGLPFHQLSNGTKNIILGSISPIKLTVHTLLLPLAFFGMNFNPT